MTTSRVVGAFRQWGCVHVAAALRAAISRASERLVHMLRGCRGCRGCQVIFLAVSESLLAVSAAAVAVSHVACSFCRELDFWRHNPFTWRKALSGSKLARRCFDATKTGGVASLGVICGMAHAKRGAASLNRAH